MWEFCVGFQVFTAGLRDKNRVPNIMSYSTAFTLQTFVYSVTLVRERTKSTERVGGVSANFCG
jgi:hypothetical protein